MHWQKRMTGPRLTDGDYGSSARSELYFDSKRKLKCTKLARRSPFVEVIVVVLSSLPSSSLSCCRSGDRCALLWGPFSRESHFERLILKFSAS